MHKHRITALRLNLLIIVAEGMFVLWQYLQRPSESQSALLWGFSAIRLILLFAIGFVILVLLFLFVKFTTDPVRIQKAKDVLDLTIEQVSTFWVLFIPLGLAYLALFLSDHQFGPLASYRETSGPLLVWLGVVSLQLLISYILVRSFEKSVLREYRDMLIPSGVVLVFLGGVLAFISFTRIGLKPDSIYWQEAGVPILLHQVILALTVSIVVYSIRFKIKGLSSRNVDLFVVAVLWLLACVLWLNRPLKPAYNSMAPTPPNYQNYPFGDALRHDLTAQEFMLGQPIPPDFFVKPFYSFLLVLFHLVGGQDFNHIVFIQVSLLAFIPPLTYLLTKDLSSPLAGMIAGLLMIIRERNAIALSNVIQVSNSRLLLSDVPVMGLMVLLTWLIVRWSRQLSDRKSIPLTIGGVLGLLILTRGNPVILIPFVLLAGFLIVQKIKVFWIEFFLPLSLGLLLVLLPWFWHNYQITGKPVFQDPLSPSLAQDQLSQTYSGTSGNGSVVSDIYGYLLVDPAETVRFVSAHFFHNIIYSYIFLPQSFLIEPAIQYARRLPFWSDWRGDLPWQAWILMAFHLGVLALGFGSGWKKKRCVVLVPLILGVGYNLSVALARRSGWRFILPADWYTILFYAIGLEQLMIIGYSLVINRLKSSTVVQSSEQSQPVYNTNQRHFALLASFFLFISLGVTQGHRLFPTRNNVMDGQIATDIYRSMLPGLSQAFLEQSDAVVLHGRGLYPTYLHAGDGVLNYSYLNFSEQPYNRLVFELIDEKIYGVVLKTDTVPQNFPDGADIVVAGCVTDKGYIEALAVLVETEPPSLYVREPSILLNCPIPAP